MLIGIFLGQTLPHALRSMTLITRYRVKTKKRFIAGAKCPSCGSLDTLMLYFENNVEKLSPSDEVMSIIEVLRHKND